MSYTYTRQLVAEFTGTLFLLATVVGSGIMAQTLSPDSTALALLANTVATGAMLVVLISMFGQISGAHFNPAVTLGFLLRGELKLPGAIGYWLAQCAGGIAGVMLAHGMFEQPLLQWSSTARTGGGQWLAEGVATFGLLATIFTVLRFRPDSVPMAVGLYITAGYWFTASTCFANPAVTLSRSLTDTFAGIAPADVMAFIATQLFAAALATLFCRWLTKPG